MEETYTFEGYRVHYSSITGTFEVKTDGGFTTIFSSRGMCRKDSEKAFKEFLEGKDKVISIDCVSDLCYELIEKKVSEKDREKLSIILGILDL